MTFVGGAAPGQGTIFKITPTGTRTTLYSFCSQPNCADGDNPEGAALLLGTDGNFYGTTFAGGEITCNHPNGCGTVFKITPGGMLTTLHTFLNDGDGAFPYAGLVQGTDGNFYGTTTDEELRGENGTIFKITPQGALTTLHNFVGTDGSFPSGLIRATDGNFYGATALGGTKDKLVCNNNMGCGTLFMITPGGTFTSLFGFNKNDGSSPGALIQISNGDFYGVTGGGGANTTCNSNNGCGTVFKFTASGKLTTLYSFCSQANCTDGDAPQTLVQATDGKFYGNTQLGGANSCMCGTLFKITAGGALTTLHSFDMTDGAVPTGDLLQSTNGTLYGVTSSGGNSSNNGNNAGTVYSLSVGLGDFVATVPTVGTVGETVTILGTNLTGTTSVKFNGTAATFTVVSSSEITTTVPAGAITGAVKVVTRHGTLKSNVNFIVN
jgi:uncharacterized repeat protein (TIGR03803 family)